MKNYGFHPLCMLLPEPSPTEYADLKADILANGLLDPVIRLDGKILDGRSRYTCCVELGIEPQYVDFADLGFNGTPTAYVISKNLKRRHLSVEQRSIAAGKLTTLETGALTKSEASALLNVSESSVARAKRVAKNAIPEVQREVERGTVSIAQAERISKKPAKEQRAALKEEKAKAEKTLEKAVETRKATNAAKQSTSQTEKAIATYTGVSELCREKQLDGKKLHKAITGLQAAVDDLALIDSVLTDMLETGHAVHNLSLAIDVLSKHPGISTDSLEKTRQTKLGLFEAAHRKYGVMAKFVREYATLAERLFAACPETKEQDMLLEIYQEFKERKTTFEETVNRMRTSFKMQILTVVEKSALADWFRIPK